MSWDNVADTLQKAHSIAFDGCHKIYVLMDAQQTEQMHGYGYDPLVKIGEDGITPSAALGRVKDWYYASCGLRFVSAVRTVEGDANDGFTDLIAQFEEEELATRTGTAPCHGRSPSPSATTSRSPATAALL